MKIVAAYILLNTDDPLGAPSHGFVRPKDCPLGYTFCLDISFEGKQKRRCIHLREAAVFGGIDCGANECGAKEG